MEEVIDGVLVAASDLRRPLSEMRQLALSLSGLEGENAVTREQIVAVSERAIRQVDDLRKLRNLEQGLFMMEPLAVRTVCDEVMAELGALVGRGNGGGGITMGARYARRLGLVTANRELLSSVVYNFVLNALCATGEGARSELTVREARGEVQILVRDFGPMLPQSVWKEIKQGRAKAPESIAMRPGSSGLSLYIAARFSRYMKARVGAVRHRDGTSFYVGLPVSRQMALPGVL